MYLINKQKNEINQIGEKRFSDLGFKEREHLQEWIAKTPNCFGEELLIIQKEFGEFDSTNERLDLLALDKEGNLIIIENKLDDTGKDVVWQALKYASYCSTFTRNQIIEIFEKYLDKEGKNENGNNKLMEFLDIRDWTEIELNKPQSQRIFLIAANFRKEVTSTVLWLMNYNITIKCFKVTPYQFGDNLILNIDQIIPMEDSEDYTIKIAEKNQETLVTREINRERLKLNYKFWSKFIDDASKKTDLYQSINPKKESYLWKGTGTRGVTGIGGVWYSLAISKTYVRVEFYIDTPDKENNKKIYDSLSHEKEEIETELGYNLTWERLDDKKASRIKYEMVDVNINNEEDWGKMISFLIENVIKFEIVFSKRIPKIKREM